KPSEIRWRALEALKQSPKGKIKYDPYWADRGEDIMTGYSEFIGLSPRSGAIIDHLDSPPKLQRSLFSSLSPGDSSPGLSVETSVSSTKSSFDITPRDLDEETDGHAKEDDVIVSSPTSPPSISLQSPKAMEMAGCIIKFEKKQREKAQMALRLREEMQKKMVAEVARSESEQLKRFEELMELKQRQEHQAIRDMMDREAKESIGRQEKLKEEHRHRMKVINLRLREAAQQRLRQAELERQRQVEGRERLRNLNTIQEEILQLNQQLDPSTLSKDDAPLASLTPLSARGNQLCSQVSEVVRRTAEGEFPSMGDMSVVERALQDMRALIQLMQEEVNKFQETKKKQLEQEQECQRQVELQVQQEAQKAAAQLAKAKAQKKGIQNSADDSTIKWYEELQEKASQCAQSFQDLSSPANAQTKKLKQELQKAATIPVSQISSNSGSQVKELFDKIDQFLSGQPVMLEGKSVSTSMHPQAQNFAFYKVAEKFVKQGEEEVASHFEAAFPIAMVASGIWEQHPQVGELILAHLHKKCPYAVPHYPAMKDGSTVEDYQRLLGYRVDSSGVEDQNSFLKKMSGMIRLYAAIIQQKWPFSSKQGPPPHALNHGWRWLAQMLNMEPVSDITSTLLFEFLEVCGNALMSQYRDQFWKLIRLLKEEYLPRIEAVTCAGQMGSVIRLKNFIEGALRSRTISPPKGQLSAGFWRS
uniref:mRNA export factor GLE1 n=1 Tax=Takifugu rubripes TaxID=31033 RepID=A0A674NPA1_TAKRU